MIVAGDEITVDYSEIAEQVRGRINSGYYGGGRTTARVAFKYLIATTKPANEGTFRPLKLILPEGKILSARADRADGKLFEPFPTVIDAIIKALEKALPDVSPARISAPFPACAFAASGDNGALFDCHDSGHGGWGACATHDGAGPFRTMAHGDTRIIPIELQESMYPFRIRRVQLARRFRRARANFAAGSASARNTRSRCPAICRQCSTASNIRPGACKAARKASPVRLPSKKSGERKLFIRAKAIRWKPATYHRRNRWWRGLRPSAGASAGTCRA